MVRYTLQGRDALELVNERGEAAAKNAETYTLSERASGISIRQDDWEARMLRGNPLTSDEESSIIVALRAMPTMKGRISVVQQIAQSDRLQSVYLYGIALARGDDQLDARDGALLRELLRKYRDPMDWNDSQFEDIVRLKSLRPWWGELRVVSWVFRQGDRLIYESQPLAAEAHRLEFTGSINPDVNFEGQHPSVLLARRRQTKNARFYDEIMRASYPTRAAALWGSIDWSNREEPRQLLGMAEQVFNIQQHVDSVLEALSLCASASRH